MLAVVIASLFNTVVLLGLLASIIGWVIGARGTIGDALAFDPLDVRPVPADLSWTPA
jgi:hypothetical protein